MATTLKRDTFGSGGYQYTHTAVLGRSESGKSFASQLAVIRGARAGVSQFIITTEGEYREIAESLGGEVFRAGTPARGVNLFDFTRIAPQMRSCRVQWIKAFVRAILREELTARELAALDTVLHQHAQEGGRNFDDLMRRVLSESSPDWRRLASLLSASFTDDLRQLFDGEISESNLLAGPIVVVDMSQMVPNSRESMALILSYLHALWILAGDSDRRVSLVIDSADDIFQSNHAMLAFLYTLKSGRKQGLGIHLVHQDIDPFINEDSHRLYAVLRNVREFLLMGPSSRMVRMFSQFFGIEPNLHYGLANMRRGTGYLVTDVDRSTLAIEASAEESLIMSSDPPR